MHTEKLFKKNDFLVSVVVHTGGGVRKLRTFPQLLGVSCAFPQKKYTLNSLNSLILTFNSIFRQSQTDLLHNELKSIKNIFSWYRFNRSLRYRQCTLDEYLFEMEDFKLHEVLVLFNYSIQILKQYAMIILL